MTRVFLSTGSNQGDRLHLLVQAAKLISIKVGKVMDYSPVVESEPWGFEAETNFYNQVILIETDLTVQQVLSEILGIEISMGRVRDEAVYTSRSIDIDILFYDSMLIEMENLSIPHPRLHNRKFVLYPMTTIEPGFMHPGLHTSIAELFEMCSDNNHVDTIIEKAEFKKLFESITLS